MKKLNLFDKAEILHPGRLLPIVGGNSTISIRLDNGYSETHDNGHSTAYDNGNSKHHDTGNSFRDDA